MNQPHRLFDCLAEQLKYGGNEATFAAKEAGQWRKYSTAEVKDIVDQLSAGLLAQGYSGGDMSVEGRDKIAILAKNRPEWMFLDLAVQQMGAILVPLYPTIHINDLEFVLNDAQVKAVFVNDEDLFHKVQNVRSKTSSIKDIYSFEHVEGAKHWKELLSLGKQEHYQQLTTISEKITIEDLFTIIYTSGTTGTPKGVMLSHRNLLSNVMASMALFSSRRKNESIKFFTAEPYF